MTVSPVLDCVHDCRVTQADAIREPAAGAGTV
jgi:hypothetical protein